LNEARFIGDSGEDEEDQIGVNVSMVEQQP
jgi:hypothetical protein